MFERFRLSNLSRTFRLRGGGTELARDKKNPQRQQCVTVLFLDDITHTFRIEVPPYRLDTVALMALKGRPFPSRLLEF